MNNTSNLSLHFSVHLQYLHQDSGRKARGVKWKHIDDQFARTRARWELGYSREKKISKGAWQLASCQDISNINC
ncbi:hypothetical protein K1719_029412 [Acacia pycnantha]|nr:hypothetical protein K1719_029412 [Acacia pycnantha]